MQNKYNIIPIFNTFGTSILADSEDEALEKFLANVTPEYLKKYIKAVNPKHHIAQCMMEIRYDTNEFTLINCKLNTKTREVFGLEPSKKKINGAVTERLVHFINGIYHTIVITDDSEIPTDENVLWYREN